MRTLQSANDMGERLMLYRISLLKDLMHQLPQAARVIGCAFTNDTTQWELTVVLDGDANRTKELRGFAVIPVLGEHSVDARALSLVPSIGVAWHPGNGMLFAVYDLGHITSTATRHIIQSESVNQRAYGGSHEACGTRLWPRTDEGLLQAFRIEGAAQR